MPPKLKRKANLEKNELINAVKKQRTKKQRTHNQQPSSSHGPRPTTTANALVVHNKASGSGSQVCPSPEKVGNNLAHAMLQTYVEQYKRNGKLPKPMLNKMMHDMQRVIDAPSSPVTHIIAQVPPNCTKKHTYVDLALKVAYHSFVAGLTLYVSILGWDGIKLGKLKSVAYIGMIREVWKQAGYTPNWKVVAGKAAANALKKVLTS